MRTIDDRPELWPFILVSILLHLLLIIALPRVVVPAYVSEKPIEVVPIVEQPENKGRLQIADIAEPEVQKKPKQYKFLGMYDSSVADESVAVTRKPGKSGESGRKASSERQQTMKERAQSRNKGNLFAFDSSLFDAKQKKAQPAAKEKSAGEGGTLDDFHPDFRRGARTYLNVLRYPDVEYFVRLKRAFKMTFDPSPPLREYFSMNQITRGSIDVVLGVSVDRAGGLAELFIFRGSGIPGYDGEAMRTVRASAPFSAPPSKFIDDDGYLRMSWTFTVYL